MPSPKSGTPGSLVSPTGPQDPQDADLADPGAVDQFDLQNQASGTGNTGSTPVKTFKKSSDDAESKKKTGWIGLKMVDKEGKPVPGLRYRITLPDDSVDEGTLDEKGTVRIDGFDPGSCKITFPDLDRRAWKPK